VFVIDELPYIDFPLHTVIKLTTLAYGCAEEHVNFGIDAVSTHIPRPQVIYVFFLTSHQTAFSALTLVVGRQEGHPACKN